MLGLNGVTKTSLNSLKTLTSFLIPFFVAIPTMAQSPDPEPVIDWQKHVTDNQRLDVLGFDLMGDQVDYNNGSVTFEHTDVSIPGNSSLSVAIKRRLTRGILYDQSQASEFGNWEMIVPRITAVTHEDTNFRTGNRCSGANQFQPIFMKQKVPPGTTVNYTNTTPNVQGYQYSQGLQLSTAEYGSEQVLRSGLSSNLGPYSASDKYVTRSNFKFSCLSNITGGGEGFIGTSPDGITYRFDRFYERHTQDQILSNYEDADAKRYRSIVAATQVTDIHGNWVKYDYDSYNRLTRIHSNDGRSITLSYSGANSPVSSVTTNGRTWNYSYATRSQNYAYQEWGSQSQAGQSYDSLTQVTLPDNRTWQIEALNYDKPTELDGCTPYDMPTPMGDFDVFIKHPSGAWGKFKFDPVRRRVGHKLLESKQVYGATNPWAPSAPTNGSGVTIACPSLHSINRHIAIDGGPGGQTPNVPPPGDDSNPNNPPQSYTTTVSANLLMYRHMMALVKKEIANPNDSNFPTSVWHIDYEEIPLVHYTDQSTVPSVPASEQDNWTKLIEPNSSEITHAYHWDENTYGGELKRKEYRASAGASALLRSEDYTYLNQTVSVGIPEFNAIYPPAKQRHPVYQTGVVLAQDGDTYTNTTSYNTNIYSSGYSFGKPTQTQSSSNVSTSPRITDTTYEHKTANWILGLTKTVTQVGLSTTPAFEYSYDSLGRKTSETKYGHTYATYGYNSDGTLSWFKDANNRTTHAYNWKRGTPQQIKRPDNASVYQYVDNNGWLTSTKDAKGQTTTYSRDNMGRLTTYDPPIQSSTNISYSFPSSGGAIQTITRGPKTETISYDALYRPTLVNLGNQIYTRSTYNSAGETTFESFPSSSSYAPNGTSYTYDGLGRVYSESTAAGTTNHRYYNSHRHRVTDPSGKWTDFYAYGYDGPGSDNHRAIYEYANGAYLRKTYIYKNVWSETTRVRQWGNLNGHNVDENQYLYYDSRRRICRYRTKEGGDTVFAYDNAGWLTSYQKGLSNGSSCSTPTGSAKVTLTRDVLGQVTLTNFADSNTPDIYKTYDENGNVKTVNRGGANWTYAYNQIDQLTSETLAIDGRSYPLTYTYNTHGYMTRRTLPTGRQINFTHDSLGRQSSVKNGTSNLASNISWHPNGMSAGFTYGNGHIYTKTLNALLQPTQVSSVKGGTTAFNRYYGYDNRGLITSITDSTDSSYNQTFGYDGLGQLTSASGKWGTGSFKYDSLGNIRQKKLGSRTVNMSYNSLNRLTSYTDTTGPNKSLSYDSRGNVTALGGLNFTYDMADQPRAISGSSSGTYKYDGNLKRVKASVGGVTIYNVYDASGSLVHVDDLGTGGKTDYVSGAGTSLARIRNNVVTYLHNDHLGSTATGTNQSGTVLWTQRFTPFGEEWNNIASNDNQAGFTGHIKDAATGLNYMQARYYDPVIGRFLSTDPVNIVISGYDPRYFNRYTYVANNPINAVDPTGMSLKSWRMQEAENHRSYRAAVSAYADYKQSISTNTNSATLVKIAENGKGSGSRTPAIYGTANDQVSQTLCGAGTCVIDISKTNFLDKIIKGRHGLDGRKKLSDPLYKGRVKGVFDARVSDRDTMQKLAALTLRRGTASPAAFPGRFNVDLQFTFGSVGRDFSASAGGMIEANGIRLQVQRMPGGNYVATSMFPKHFYD